MQGATVDVECDPTDNCSLLTTLRSRGFDAVANWLGYRIPTKRQRHKGGCWVGRDSVGAGLGILDSVKNQAAAEQFVNRRQIPQDGVGRFG